ncbi:MAG TPA: protein kinase, partial [Urbifossiella sp.]|nr:protein kinase [Urbifossiella sp.]
MSDETIFAAALEKADPAERTAFLDKACPDPEARARLDRLLAAHDQAGAFMQRPAVAPEGFPTLTQTSDGGGKAEPDEALAFLTPSARPDALGRIGHYDVLQVLGQGAFGIVFRAFDDVLQRVVAVKVMAPLLAATSPARKRFLREARSSAQVRHENVVQVYEVAEHPLPYIAMEFIPGETLQERLNRLGPVDAAEVVRVGRQIAEGLAAAHASDLIHRDIKPGNVLIEGGQHRVKITDFGLARAADDASISQSGIIAGTPMYMAPEQALGQKLDQRADLFSLGSVLYQMAAGRPPFRANGTVAVLKRVAEDTPRDIREITPETPTWLCDIIAKLHAKNPDDRYQSAREVADVLADCEAQLKANSKLKDFSRIPRGSRPARRRKWGSVAAVVLLLPLAVLAVTEATGVTHVFRGQTTTTDPNRFGDGSPAPGANEKSRPAPSEHSLWFNGKSSCVQIPSFSYGGEHPLTVEVWAVIERPPDETSEQLVGNGFEMSGFGIAGGPRSQPGGKQWAFNLALNHQPYPARACERNWTPRNQPLHLAGVYDGDTEVRFYLDGELQDRRPAKGGHRPAASALMLGARAKGNGYFLGRMNGVRISKVARY